MASAAAAMNAAPHACCGAARQSLRAGVMAGPLAASSGCRAPQQQPLRARVVAGASSASSGCRAAQHLRWAASALVSATLQLAQPQLACAAAGAALEAAPPMLPCKPGTSCVSSSSFMQPAQYLPAWVQPESRDKAFRALSSELAEMGASITASDVGAGYIAASITFPREQEVYTLMFWLQPDGVVLFRGEAAGASRPYPVACFTPGCISGPRARTHLEAVRDRLGWSPLETDEDKRWQQILLH